MPASPPRPHTENALGVIRYWSWSQRVAERQIILIKFVPNEQTASTWAAIIWNWLGMLVSCKSKEIFLILLPLYEAVIGPRPKYMLDLFLRPQEL